MRHEKLSLESIAVEYAQRTGCDAARAMQAAFVAATLLADLTGNKEIGDYFAGRAAEMERRKPGNPMVPYTETPLIDRGEPITGNEQSARMYRPGGVWHWE